MKSKCDKKDDIQLEWVSTLFEQWMMALCDNALYFSSVNVGYRNAFQNLNVMFTDDLA